MSKAIEPAGAAIPRSRGEHERQIARAGRLAKALLKCDQQLLGNRDPDKSPDRQRVTIDNQLGGRLGRDDLRAPPSRRGAMLSDPGAAQSREGRAFCGLSRTASKLRHE